MIYLDYAATTPLHPAAAQAMRAWLPPEGAFGNPASSHAAGRLAAAAVQQATRQLAAAIGANDDEIIWTSGATEASNLAIKGAYEFYGKRGRHIVSSRIEHKSVLDSCRHLQAQGASVSWLEPDADGRIAAESVMAALRDDTILVSLMWVNNETGVITDIPALAPQLRERGVLLHVDAAQALGKLAVDMSAVPVDLLSIAGHKIYGPQGIGALYVRRKPRARLMPQMHGGGHQQGMRSGTLPVHQIAALGAAAAQLKQALAEQPRLDELRGGFEQRLLAEPEIQINGGAAPRAANYCNFSVGGVHGEALRASLPALCLSSGSACSSATAEPSYVLRSLGRSDLLAGASLRLSLGLPSSAEDVDAAGGQIISAIRRLRALARGRQPAAAELDNFYGYPAPVWRRFAAAAHLGQRLGGDQLSAAGSAEAAAAQIRIDLQLRVEGDRLVAVTGQVLGCPVSIAVADYLVERLSGATVQELQALAAQDLIAELEIPESHLHCALVGEDLCRDLHQQLQTTVTSIP